MGKIISVIGSPNSGKTVFSVKLAEEIVHSRKAKVIVLTADLTVPSLSFIFPTQKSSELYSLGNVLSKTDVDETSLLRNTVTSKNKPNLGFLGFKGGENFLSFPRVTEDKVSELYIKLRNIADYIIADTTCNPYDLITDYALRFADNKIRLVSPELKSICYFSSYGNSSDGCITVMNISDNDRLLPVNEVKQHFGDVFETLPFSRELRTQVFAGDLTNHLSDIRYNKAMHKVAQRVM